MHDFGETAPTPTQARWILTITFIVCAVSAILVICFCDCKSSKPQETTIEKTK